MNKVLVSDDIIYSKSKFLKFRLFFVIVMSDTSVSDAYAVAERVCKIIAMKPFTLSDKNTTHNVIVSIGVT